MFLKEIHAVFLFAFHFVKYYYFTYNFLLVYVSIDQRAIISKKKVGGNGKGKK